MPSGAHMTTKDGTAPTDGFEQWQQTRPGTSVGNLSPLETEKTRSTFSSHVAGKRDRLPSNFFRLRESNWAAALASLVVSSPPLLDGKGDDGEREGSGVGWPTGETQGGWTGEERPSSCGVDGS